MYFEFWVAFGKVDTSNDGLIDLTEFIMAKKMVSQWLGKIIDPEIEFNIIDSKGNGKISFGEFTKWGLKVLRG